MGAEGNLRSAVNHWQSGFNKENNLFLYVGCYSNKSPDGICAYAFNQVSCTIQEIQKVTHLVHASFLAIDEQNHRLYAVSEQVSNDPKVSGEVFSFAIEESGKLKLINKEQTCGQAPCHLSLNRDKDRLVVVNYLSGTVVLFPIDSQGVIGKPLDIVCHSGSSVNLDRQGSAHPHSACFLPGEDILFVPDLGLDKIFSYRLTQDRLSLIGETEIEQGAGPRHFTIHPHLPVAYSINELDSTVSCFRIHQGQLNLFQTLSCLPPNSKGENMAAEISIHPNGNTLYCSNRGHDSITVFQIDDDGRLTFSDAINTMIMTPRHFNITPNGKFLIVANQDEHNIVSFEIDLESGGLVEPKVIAYASEPVCIKYLLKA